VRPALALVLLLVLALPGAPALAQTRTYKVAVMEATPPFSYRGPDGTLTGFNVEIMREACRAMKATCSFEEIPFQAITDDVSTGRYDFGLANFLRTPEREAKLTYSAPYWRSSSSFIGPVESANTPGVEAIRGAKVAAIKTSRQFTYLRRFERDVGQLVPVTDLEELWEALRTRKADYGLVPTLAAFGFLLSDDGRRFSTVGTPVAEDGLGGTVHIVMPKGRNDLKAVVDEAIGAIRVDGSYQDVNRRYFPFDVY
jgi:ABC-type amino acid transport substrate-binding protein